MATRATVSGPDVGRGEAAGEGEDGAVDVVEVGLGAQRADLGLPVRRHKSSISPGMAMAQFHKPIWRSEGFYWCSTNCSQLAQLGYTI